MTITMSAHSSSFPSLHLCHSSFSNPSVALPMSQLILQPFRCFTYATAHSPTLPSLYLHHNSFSNPSIASPTSQLILQPFCGFTYVTVHSPTLLSLFLCHRFSLTSPGEPPMDKFVELWNCHIKYQNFMILIVDPAGPVVTILATGYEVRGFKPGRCRWIFQSVKILSMTSFGREVKPWNPCRRFMACKWTSSRN